jgi:hypothetical protein
MAPSQTVPARDHQSPAEGAIRGVAPGLRGESDALRRSRRFPMALFGLARPDVLLDAFFSFERAVRSLETAPIRRIRSSSGAMTAALLIASSRSKRSPPSISASAAFVSTSPASSTSIGGSRGLDGGRLFGGDKDDLSKTRITMVWFPSNKSITHDGSHPCGCYVFPSFFLRAFSARRTTTGPVETHRVRNTHTMTTHTGSTFIFKESNSSGD